MTRGTGKISMKPPSPSRYVQENWRRSNELIILTSISFYGYWQFNYKNISTAKTAADFIISST